MLVFVFVLHLLQIMQICLTQPGSDDLRWMLQQVQVNYRTIVLNFKTVGWILRLFTNAEILLRLIKQDKII